MLQEAADELEGVQRHRTLSSTTGLSVAEGDLSAITRSDAMIGDGDTEDIRSEIFQAIASVTNSLRVDTPRLLPHVRIDLVVQDMLFDRFSELYTVDHGESLNRDKEVWA